ncbi:hypothetical protein ES702_01392 [subsurface metagenome]
MTRLIVQSYVWNAAQFITAPILALHGYVDEIQIFDGAWKGYPTAKVPWSTDGTEQVVKNLKLDCPLQWIPCKEFYKSQVAKKTFMLKYWHPNEWRYLMADDEVPVGNIKGAFERVRRADQKIMIGFIPTVRIMLHPKPHLFQRKRKYAPRLFRWQKGFHYGKTHNIILNAEKMFRDNWRPRIFLDEMLIVHLKWLRHKERREAQLKYQKKPH